VLTSLAIAEQHDRLTSLQRAVEARRGQLCWLDDRRHVEVELRNIFEAREFRLASGRRTGSEPGRLHRCEYSGAGCVNVIAKTAPTALTRRTT
jgi:hypothetical protein